MDDDEQTQVELIRVGANLKGLEWAFEDEDDDALEDPEFLDEAPAAAIAQLALSLADRNRKAALIKGVIWHACVAAVDLLFEALQDWEAIEAEPWHKGVHPVLGSLPGRFKHRYDARFVQKFLVVTVDVTTSLAGEWSPLPTVAHELALRAILDQAEVWEDLYELDLGEHWRSDLEEQLFDDLDHDLLYDPAMDGIEDYSELGLNIVPMGFDSWFSQFNDRPRSAPYATTPYLGDVSET